MQAWAHFAGSGKLAIASESIMLTGRRSAWDSNQTTFQLKKIYVRLGPQKGNSWNREGMQNVSLINFILIGHSLHIKWPRWCSLVGCCLALHYKSNSIRTSGEARQRNPLGIKPVRQKILKVDNEKAKPFLSLAKASSSDTPSSGNGTAGIQVVQFTFLSTKGKA